jgi:hypothetical protein
MKTFNPEHAFVSSAMGGSLSQVFLGENTRARVVTTHGGTSRRKLRGFPKLAAGIFSGAWLALIARLLELIKGKSSL